MRQSGSLRSQTAPRHRRARRCRMEGRWNGEAQTIPATDGSVRVCSVQRTCLVLGGCLGWHDRLRGVARLMAHCRTSVLPRDPQCRSTRTKAAGANARRSLRLRASPLPRCGNSMVPYRTCDHRSPMRALFLAARPLCSQHMVMRPVANGVAEVSVVGLAYHPRTTRL